MKKFNEKVFNGGYLNASGKHSGLKNYFKRTLLSAYAAAVSSHSEDVCPTEPSLCLKSKLKKEAGWDFNFNKYIKSNFGKFHLMSFNPLSLNHKNKTKSWIASILTDFAMTERRNFYSNFLSHSGLKSHS